MAYNLLLRLSIIHCYLIAKREVSCDENQIGCSDELRKTWIYIFSGYLCKYVSDIEINEFQIDMPGINFINMPIQW